MDGDYLLVFAQNAEVTLENVELRTLTQVAAE
jgi:hypothetical protein